MEAQLSILNPTPTKLAGPDLLHGLVAKGSEDVAIEYQDLNKKNVRITYNHFHDQTDRLARYICKTLESPSATTNSRRSIVPLLLPQSPSLYVSQLAILKAGSAFCPLPIDAPEDRLRFILQDVSAKIVLTNGDLLHKLPKVDGVDIVNVDDYDDQMSVEGNAFRPVTTDDLAYVMYTSGSTGLPKGVLLSHAAATQALLAHDRHIPSYSRFLQVAAPTFDVSVFEIFFTFFRGRTLVCCDRTQLLADLPGTINGLNIDAAELTPSVASNLLGPRDGVPALKVLLTIGEMLKKDVVESYGGTSTEGAVLHGMYGPTEAAIHCTLQPQFSADMAVNNIGIPLDTVSAFVLPPVNDNTPPDASLAILPYGTEGELAVGGFQLADGYLNRDEQTQAAFVRHPQHGRLYRTGDKARFVEGKKIECLGRISAGQVKLRGQRMELGEVEYAVAKTSGCTGAVAEVIADTLVAFCKHGTAAISEEDVRQTCKKWLPAYMIPSEIVLKDDLPYLASGKIDRRSLRNEYETLNREEAPTELPSGDDLTSQITSVIQDTLGLHSVRGQDLTIASIDSLSSIRIAAALGKLGYGQLMATQVMEAHTVHSLSNLLQDNSDSTSPAAKEMSDVLIKQRIEGALLDPLIAARKAEFEEILPCSAVQASMLAETSMKPQRYCNWLEFEVKPSYSLAEVEAALLKLVQHHSLMRAGFVNVAGQSGGFTMVIWKTNQILIVEEFDRHFLLEDAHQLLQACKIQLSQESGAVRILLQIHHALYDQWSVDVLVHDLEMLLAGQAIETPSFVDVLTYYTTNVESAISSESIAFWTDAISGTEPVAFPNTNALKTDNEQQRTEWQQLNIDESLLQRIAHDRNWSAQSFVQAAFATILTFFHGSTSVCYGTVFSGRHIPVAGIDRTFGPCLTTLPVHVDRGSLRSWADIVKKVHDLNRQILKFADTPLSQIKQLSSLAADDNLFDTLFLWQESVIAADASKDLCELDSADYHEFKLALECRPLPGTIEARITYDTALIPRSQAETILKSVESLVNIMLTDLDGDIIHLHQQLPQHLLSVSNPNPVEESRNQDLAEVLERAGLQHSQHTAVLFATSLSDNKVEAQSMTYQDLHQQSNQLARRIRSIGVQPDDLVCICMEKSLEFYVSVLATFKAGAGYLPLVPELKTERVTAILDQARVKAVLTDKFGIKHFKSTPAEVLQPPQWNLTDYSKDALEARFDNSHVAYTIFTSGSTGVPKGVVVTRGNLLGNILTLQKLYHANAGDRLLQACLQSFDVSVFEIFFTFYTGMTLCTAIKETLFDDLEESIRALEVTHLSMTPSVASLVNPDNVPSVQFLVTAGEAMTAAVHTAWAGKGLHQGYGPSETTNICTVNLDITAQHHLGSIGPPFVNTSAFVLDAGGQRRILPQGAFGEFAFGGEQVFRGYLGLDDLNKEKIWDHPQYGRLYRSGDLGRILADGTLLIHGRSDFQVKIRGNRVELGEISASILRHGFVDDCVTIVNTTDKSEPALLSFWTRPGGKPPAQVADLTTDLLAMNGQIFQALSNYLPSYMLPTFIIPVTVLPRTEQGKMDHRSLRSLANEVSADTRQQLTRPQEREDIPYHSSEPIITEALSEVLNVPDSELDRIAPFESFGLTSISAVTFARVLRRLLDKPIPVSKIFRNASIAKLAHAIEECSSTQSATPASSIDFFDDEFVQKVIEDMANAGKVEEVLPCTPLQEAMLAAGAAQGSAYSNSTTFNINGDISKLKRCFEELFIRHPILRTQFIETEKADRPYAQVVFKEKALPWVDTREERANVEHEVTHKRPISIEVVDTEHGLELTIHMHHATYDGTSLAILLSDIESLYANIELQAPPAPTEFLRACLRQSGTAAQHFWSRQFQDFSPRPFPVLELEQQYPQEMRQHRRLADTTHEIELFCKDHSVDFSSVMQTAWAKCLAMLQHAQDICFGNVVSGRLPELSDIDRLALPCFNTLPVRVRINKGKTNLDLVRQLSRVRSSNAAYQLAPLRMIQRKSKRPSARLFDSLLLLQAPEQELDKHLWQYKCETGEMGFPLVLEITTKFKRLDLHLYHMSDRIDSSTALAIAALFDKSLHLIINRPDDLASDSFWQQYDHLAGCLSSKVTDQGNGANATTDDEPWNDVESKIREILSSLAKTELPKIKKSTTIYELGLDSLNAAQVAAQLRRSGFKIDMADILEFRTPSGIAKAISSDDSLPGEQTDYKDLKRFDEQHRGHICKTLQVSPASIEAVRPCTASQQGMLAQAIASNGKLYVNHVHFAVASETTLDKLNDCLKLVSQKHPLLRTLFVKTESDAASFVMAVMVDVPTGTEAEVEANHNDVTYAEEISTLGDRPLWRACLSVGEETNELILSIHHALYDATSLQILQSDLAKSLETGSVESRYSIDDILVSNLPSKTSQASSSKTFWEESLRTASFIPFPNLTSRQVKSNAIKTASRQIDASLPDLESLCKDRGCTIQAAGQAAWAQLLFSYLGEPTVTFGTVLSTRSHSEHESQLFPSINTLPVTAQANGTMSELLQTMVKYNSGLQRHRVVSLSDIQRFAGKPGQTLFDTVFVFQGIQQTHNSTLFPIVRQSSAVDYKISIEFECLDTATVQLTISYAESSLDPAGAVLLLKQYEAVLVSVLRGTEKPSYDTSLLAITSPLKPTLPAPVSLLHEFVTLGARNFPDRPALEFISDLDDLEHGRQSWTYAELDLLSNNLANMFKQSDVQPGGVIALCMDKCVEASLTFAAILKTGCAFLAIDPDLPKARKEFILQDSKARLLVTSKITNIGDLETHTNILSIALEDVEAAPYTEYVSVEIDPQSTCYCLYTSGTTGAPKGCEITHENAVQAMMSFQRLFAGRWNGSSRWLQFASYWFDVSVLEHFWSWSVGITMVGAPRDLVLGDLVSFINEAHITHIDLTPSLARLLDPDEVPSLCNGVFITGGEALKQEIIQKWGQHEVICNGYGPTEATIGVTMNPFIGSDARPANIGPPFANVGSFVLDTETNQPVLRGAIGELCVSGKLVGKGYLNRQDLTEKAFPTLEHLGQRVYRTGDLVRQLVDDTFLFIGRKDSQAKLRGQRLEIDEIDEVIKSATSSIIDVTSLVIKSEDGNKQTLVSFITISHQSDAMLQLQADDVAKTALTKAIDGCRSHLPGYMVPTSIIPVTRIPLTVNNKVDAKSLVSFYNNLSTQDLQGLSGSEQLSLNEEGKKIANVLAQMLSLNAGDMDARSNLFTLGLSSVSVIQFVQKLRNAGYKDADIGSIMRTPELGQLTKLLTSDSKPNGTAASQIQQAELLVAACDRRHRRSAAAQLNISVSELEIVIPCTPLQNGLIVESVQHEQHPYFNTFHLRSDSLDLDKFEKALRILVDSIQILKVKFVDTDDGYVQAVPREVPLPFKKTLCETKGLDKHLRQAKDQWISANLDGLHHPFAVMVTSIPGSSALISLHLHHAIYDGISLDLLLRALAQIYNDKAPELGPTFSDILPYGPLQKVAGAEHYWRQSLEHLAFQPLVAHEDSPEKARTVTATFSVSSQQIETTRKIAKVSHQAVIQSIFQVAIRETFPQCCSFGLVVSGRSLAVDDAEKVIGPMFNTLPVSIRIENGATWNQLILQGHDFNIASLPYQFTPLRDIKKWCKIAANEDLFDVLFVFRIAEDEPRDVGSLGESVYEEPYADYALAFEATLTQHGIVDVTMVANRVHVNEDSLVALKEHFTEAVKAISESLDARVSAKFTNAASDFLSSSAKKHRNDADMNGVHNFTWSPRAKVIQKELSSLASLTIEDIDEHATLFGLGLDSIDAVRLASRLKKKDIVLSVSDLIKAQTIPRMLAAGKTNENGHTATPFATLQSLQEQLRKHLELPRDLDETNIEDILPATPSQEALLALMQESHLTNYFNHDLLKLARHVDIEKLRQAWQHATKCHTILRTSFVQIYDPEVECIFAQVVHKSNPLAASSATLRHQSEIEALMDKIREDVAMSFHTSPPFRVTFLRIDEQPYLLLSLAHALYDGHSLTLLHQDVEKAYHGQSITRPSSNSAIENALLANSDKSRQFWRDTLHGAEPCLLLSKQVNAEGRIHRLEAQSRISTPRARTFCREHAISMQTLGQTCWALTLAHYKQKLEVIFGTVLACRDSEEAEAVMFPTMNTIVLRAALHGTAEDMLSYIQDFAGEMLPHKQTPLRSIQAAYADAGTQRAADGLFDTLFIYQQRPQDANENSEPLYQSTMSSSSIEYLVAVEMEVVNESIVMRVAAKDEVFSEKDTDLLLKTYLSVLDAVVVTPSQAAVSFEGDNASICGLPPFTLGQSKPQEATSTTSLSISEGGLDTTSSTYNSIVNVLAQVSGLPTDEISPKSTLESMGIDSISAIKVAALLRKKKIKTTVNSLVKAKSISAIKVTSSTNGSVTPKELTSHDKWSTLLSACDIERTGVGKDNIQAFMPATAGQIYMLGVWRMSRGRLFHPIFHYSLDKALDSSQIDEAWQQLVRQHDVLRTIFVATKDQNAPIAQVVLTSIDRPVTHDKEWSATDVTQPMVALQAHPTNNGWSLALRIHHALYDAVSLELMLQDLANLLGKRSISLPQVSMQDLLRETTTPRAKAAQRHFWNEYLSGISPMSLATERKTNDSGRVEVFKPAIATSMTSLEKAARKKHVGIQSVLFAIWSKVYCKLIGRMHKTADAADDAVIGIYLSNRGHFQDMLELRAPTVNLVPLVVRGPADRGVWDIAQDIQRDLKSIGDVNNSAAALWEISEWTNIQVDTFVNFLKLPEGMNDGKADSTIVIEDLDGKRQNERAEVVPLTVEDVFTLPKELATMPEWRDVYRDSLDVELRISGDNLDVGVFVLAQLASLREVQALLRDIVDEIQRCTA